MTPIFFYLHPRKIEFKCLPGHIVDAIDVVVVKEQVLSFPVRVTFSVQHFACHELKADENTPCCSSGRLYVFWWLAPPLSQGIVGRAVGGARGI